jgi:hypothetical protein
MSGQNSDHDAIVSIIKTRKGRCSKGLRRTEIHNLLTINLMDRHILDQGVSVYEPILDPNNREASLLEEALHSAD